MKEITLRAIGFAVLFGAICSSCGGKTARDNGDSTTPAPQTSEVSAGNPAPASQAEPEPLTTAEPDRALQPAPAGEEIRIDYLTFAQGAVPMHIGGAGADLGANFEHAVRIIDGDPGHFSFLSKADSTTDTEFVYALAARTTFDRFAVSDVNETPSPMQTFTKYVEVYGSVSGADGGWELLASATLETHEARGLVTEIPVLATIPVRWVKVRLIGGITILTEQSFFEFSEIIGNGSQETPALADHFHGIWKDRGVLMELKQEGATVTGCYDDNAELTGTVTANILRARGVDPDDGAISLFILSVVGDGLLRGVRSTNGGPFRLYTGPPAPEGTTTTCSEIPEPQLGCGSVIHGINFDFDAAAIRPDSEPVLVDLYEGLQGDPSTTIIIEGHTSSEGSDAYNQNLSERRAQAVVEDLIRRGLEGGRLTARGKGETEPLASNKDENGRSLNRRVEITCE